MPESNEYLNTFFKDIYSDNKIYVLFLIFISYIIFNETVKNNIINAEKLWPMAVDIEKYILEYFQLRLDNTCKLINNDFVESEKLSDEKYDLTKEYIESLYSKMNNILFNYDFKNKFYDYQTDNFKEQIKIQKELRDKLRTTQINKNKLESIVSSTKKDEVLLERIKEEEQRKKIEDEKNRELKKKQEEDEKKKQEEMRLKRIEDKKLQKIKAIVDRDQSAGGKNQSKKRKNKLTKNNSKNNNKSKNKNNRKKRSLKN
jgi:hypothetical protein